jgi:hypothetical protein
MIALLFKLVAAGRRVFTHLRDAAILIRGTGGWSALWDQAQTLLSEGGLTVVSRTQHDGREQIYAQTVCQLDGDRIQRIAPWILGDAPKIHQHLDAVDARMGEVRTILALPEAFLALSASLYGLLQTGLLIRDFSEMRTNIWTTLVSGWSRYGLLATLIPPLLWWLGRRWLQQKFEDANL